MNCKKILGTGDKIVIVDGGVEYVTTVDEVLDEQHFSVLRPSNKKHHLSMQEGVSYRAICVKSVGIHYFDVEIVGTEEYGSITLFQLRQVGNYYKIQRRGAYRCEILLDVRIRKKAHGKQEIEEWIQGKTLDISEMGMRMRLPGRFTKGDVVQFVISINKFGLCTVMPMTTGVIVRAIPIQDGTKENSCGICFSEIEPKAKDTLLKLTMLSQRNSIRW